MKDREVLQFMGSQRVRHDLATEQQHWRKSVENGSINLVFFFFFKKRCLVPGVRPVHSCPKYEGKSD